MSRGLGRLQRAVVEILSRYPEGMSLYALKRELWGTCPRYRLAGQVVVISGRRLPPHVHGGKSANLNRALAGLLRRGLVEEAVEFRSGCIRRYFRLARGAPSVGTR